MNRCLARMRLREREQRHSHRGGDGTHQSSPEDVPVEEEAEPTKKRKAEETTSREQDVENQPSKKQRLETVTCEGGIGESLMQAMERVLNHCSPKLRYGLPVRATGDRMLLALSTCSPTLTRVRRMSSTRISSSIDDVSARVLDHELAVKARTLETDFFRKMRVYDKATRAAATRDGCRVISTTWVDVNKGGPERAQNYRARLVGRELKLDSRLDFFAASPPLEAIRIICSLCANNQYGQQPHRIMTLDVKRAYFYARSRRPVYIEIPIEDFEPGGEHMVGRLNLSLYGTRDAAQNWTREYTEFLGKYWFQVRSGVTMQPF